MSVETTFPIPTRVGADGVAYATTRFTPVEDKRRPTVTVPPWTVVPVVFVPGIMGSNLKVKTQINLPSGDFIKAGARIWNVDGLTSLNDFIGKDAAYRQAVFDQHALEVDNGGKIDSQTEDLGVMGHIAVTPQARLSVDEARKRGWGTASGQYYGAFLDWLQYQLSEVRLVNGQPNAVFRTIAALAGSAPQGAKQSAAPLTETQTRKLLDIQFPVYAVGYNWLQSNLDSGRDLMQGASHGSSHVLGIDEIIARHDGVRGQTCKQVIVVTHSMGGLVARAAALAHGGESKMLGIVHGVQPIDGAAAFYKRLAAGFEGEGWGTPWVASKVLGPTSRETIPELAYSPGPLELAPNKRYHGGRPWLFIKNKEGKVLKELPEHGDPYTEIYLDTTHVWRAVNPVWLDPSGSVSDPVDRFGLSVKVAAWYHEKLGGKLHPQTYAHWGDDRSLKSWGSLTWTAEGGTWQTQDAVPKMGSVSRWHSDDYADATDPAQWAFKQPVVDAGTKRVLEAQPGHTIRMTVDRPIDAGDGTVPATASGAQIEHYAGCQIACALTGFDHQGDYNNDTVRNILLDALVRLVEPVEVTE